MPCDRRLHFWWRMEEKLVELRLGHTYLGHVWRTRTPCLSVDQELWPRWGGGRSSSVLPTKGRREEHNSSVLPTKGRRQGEPWKREPSPSKALARLITCGSSSTEVKWAVTRDEMKSKVRQQIGREYLTEDWVRLCAPWWRLYWPSLSLHCVSAIWNPDSNRCVSPAILKPGFVKIIALPSSSCGGLWGLRPLLWGPQL